MRSRQRSLILCLVDMAVDLFDNGERTNRFTFDPQTKSWTSLIRQVEHGEWKTFCEDKFVGTDAKK